MFTDSKVLTSIAIVSTQWFQLLLTQLIQFNINHMFTDSKVLTSIAI